MANTTTTIAREVIAGDWGSGDARVAALKKAGYDPTVIQNEVNRLLCCRELIIQNMQAWAKKIADSHKYKYVAWTEEYGHECAVCHPHGGANHGWQCIGFAAAVWHHAGLPTTCYCGTVADEEWEYILNASTDAAALKKAQSCLGIKELQVIRNKNGIPKSQAKPGDMAALFVNGNDYQHTYIIMPNDKVADSTHAGGYSGDIGFRNFSGRYASNMKVIIRYTGKGYTTPEKKTVDQLAHEVIDGMWGSGDSRKTALTECGYDYNAVQNRVNEILNPSKKPTSPYTGEYPVVKKYLEKGDKGTEVTKLQNYLNWYTCGEFFQKCGKADGIYGNNTLVYVKEMQTDFFGAKEADGTVGPKTIAKMKAYSDSLNPSPTPTPTPTPSSTYPGILPTYHLVKSNAQIIADAIKWGKWIASDNRFHYGKGKDAHHNGCYFCGTQPKSKHSLLDWQRTYCCNPFVGAAWAHGGCIPKAIQMCHNCSSWDFGTGSGSYHKSSLFDNLGKPAQSSLKAGDVLCNSHHVALYIGDGKVVEAGAEDDNVRNSSKWNNSIRVRALNYGSFERVYRFNSKVDADIVMAHGEVSNRVLLWQDFLNWWSDGEFYKQCGKGDGCYGDNTLVWTKKFQEAVIGKGQGDGMIGPKTLAAAAAVKK